MNRSVIVELEHILGKENVVTSRELMLNYLTDETPLPLRPKAADDLVLVRPVNADQVSAVLQAANRQTVPVYPRGGGTGLVGGAVPTRNGIILSFEKMKRIEIDEENFMAIAEAGVTLGELTEAADRTGLSFPPHPGDENAQVGGLVATNAGGSRAVRHGVMRNQVRAIRVVLPTGEILSLGRRVRKNNVGYDLMQLIIGSEGTLAVITEATIQLYPKSGATMTLILPYDSRRAALSSVPKILRKAGTPLAVEFVEKDLMERTAKHIGARWPVTSGKCFLIVIVDELSRDQVLVQSLRIAETCREDTTHEVFSAESKSDQKNILKIRSGIYTALKTGTIDLLDVTVPISELKRVIDAIDNVAEEHATHLPVYGHAADGNLHVHIMQKEGEGAQHADSIRDSIYEIATKAGGVITGEHGIGKIRTTKLSAYLTEKELELMKSIKKTFDPNGILNPGTENPLEH